MPPSHSPKASSRRSRKSIAHMPTVALADRENSTIQGFALPELEPRGNSKKTRSKSLGPGGLEALSESSGNRQKIAPMIKSILKPTIPLSPPKQIPPRNQIAAPSPAVGIDASQVDRNQGRTQDEQGTAHVTGESAKHSSLSEEQQQAAVREKEKREILERRDARRKSLANRRVSFAPEATLHTWDIVELGEDATTSSEATNSTRRASAGSTLHSTSFAQSQPEVIGSDPPSTPPGAELQVAASPAHQRDLHQKKRRRSSGVSSMNPNNLEQLSSSPLGSASSDDTRQSPDATDIIDASEIDSDEDKDTVRDDTITGVVNEDLTGHSEASAHSDKNSSTNSSAQLETQLDTSLPQAAQRADAYNNQATATADVIMDLVDDEASQNVAPIEQERPSRPPLMGNLSSLADQENVNPFSPAFAAETRKPEVDRNDNEVTMEMTQAVGRIVQPKANSQGSPQRGRRKSMPTSYRRSGVGRRRSSGESSTPDNETMDFATTYGGIQQSPSATAQRSDPADDDEEMTMELTTVMGGVVQPQNGPTDLTSAANEIDMATDMDMDFTTAVGRLLSPVTERTEPSEYGTMGMDIIKAVGSILPNDLRTGDKSIAKMLMEEEADHGQLTRSPFTQVNTQPSKTMPLGPKAFKATCTGSPEAVGTRGVSAQMPTTLKPAGTPIKTPGTPSRQLTPQPVRPTTPSKTPPSKNVSMRKTSPKKLFRAEIKKFNSKSPKASTPNLKFSKDIKTGQSIPDVILTPPAPRRISGVGIDQDGMGSPRVAAILDRRASILDCTDNFSPGRVRFGEVRFEDPVVMEQEVDNDRAEEERRESGRGILQMEAESTQEGTKELTATLKDMIQSLTPKKNKLRGRKSLAAGSAKGLLGKRPIELDEEDEDSTPKRLKGKERSPVKNILLPGPLSKDETAGRLGKAPKFILNSISGNVGTPVTEVAPLKTASTPKNHERFKDVDAVATGAMPPTSFNEQVSGASPETVLPEEAPVSLQNFLNMTNVRFMDLTTTKRRHTVAPSTDFKAEDDVAGTRAQFADCVATGACTIPMLDLFQHSCRELKKYISEGRSVVREIEKDTLEENPPLFREYMSASPGVRAIMDNQFKNIKAHARGESKRTWYEWRSKLFDGLKKGLVGIREGMVEDDKLLEQQEDLLQTRIPELVEKHASLRTQAEMMQAHAEEVANCNQDELRQTRSRLLAKEEEIEAKKKLLTDLQAQLQGLEQGIEQVQEQISEYRAEIQEAERVTNDNRGWSFAEVKALKDKCDAREVETGWCIDACTAPHVTYAYQKTLFLFAAPDHFSRPIPTLEPDLPISLSYNPPDGLYRPKLNGEPPVVHRFFTQLLQARLPALPHSRPAPSMKSVLGMISEGWQLASRLYDELMDVRMVFSTDEKIVSDDTLLIQSMVLLRAPTGVRQAQTKVEAQFFVKVLGEGTEMRWEIDVKTPVAYGEGFIPEAMRDVLVESITGENGKMGPRGWRAALLDLKGKMARKEIESTGVWKNSGYTTKEKVVDG